MQLNKEDFYTVMLFVFSVLLITYMGVELMHSAVTEKTTAAQEHAKEFSSMGIKVEIIPAGPNGTLVAR
jgi:hypothetical protein